MFISLLPTISQAGSQDMFKLLDRNNDNALSAAEYGVWAREMVVRNYHYQAFEEYMAPFVYDSSLFTIGDDSKPIPESISSHVEEALEKIIAEHDEEFKMYLEFFHR